MSILEGHLWDAESQSFISENHRRIAEIIHDYDENLFLAWVPTSARELDEKHPFAIIEHLPDGRRLVVRKLTELEMNNPHDVIAQLFLNDAQKNDIIARMDALSAAQKVMEMKATMEAYEAERDHAMTVLRSPLHTYKDENGKIYR